PVRRWRLWGSLTVLALTGLFVSGVHLYRQWEGANEVSRLHGKGEWEFACVRYVYELGTITDTDLARLAEALGRASCLKSLSIVGSQVTDKGLEHVERMTSLRWLYLGGTRITDGGLRHLKRLEHLEYLDLSGTKVTDEGVNELRLALPRLQRIRR